MPKEKITLTDKQIEDALKNGGSYKEQAKHLNVCEDVYRRERKLYDLRKGFEAKMKCLTKRDPRLEINKNGDIKQLKQRCGEIYEKSRKTIGYNEITVDLGDDDVGVQLSCDWHIGNEMTNLNRWSEDVELIAKTPRQFTILDGDFTDNLDALKKGGTYESIISVPEAKQMVSNAVTIMKDKIIGVVQGCHDEWFFSQDSWDISQYLADHCAGYWLGFEGIVNIKVGEQTYKICVRHKYRRHSTDNLCWGMLYKFRKMKQRMDVMMSAHHHRVDVRTAYDRGGLIHMLLGGSYKPFDRFIEHRDIDKGTPIMPAVLLRADRHSVIPFADFRELVDYF